MVTATELNYKNFGKCVKLDNGMASIIVTVDVGPRIISYCLNGHENMLLEDVDREFKDDSPELREYFGEDKTWYIYGGHRLWSSPESYPHSYVPDNEPVEYSVSGGEITLIPPATRTGQQHKLVYRLADEGTEVELNHEVRNVSGAIVTLAPWALTVCAAGGVEIFPQSQTDNGLLSNRRNVFWSYSDINDDRFFLGNKYGTLRQVKGSAGKFKIGMNNEDGWAAGRESRADIPQEFQHEHQRRIPGLRLQLRNVHERDLPGVREPWRDKAAQKRRSAPNHGVLVAHSLRGEFRPEERGQH